MTRGPKAKLPPTGLNETIVAMLDTLAYAAATLQRRVNAGEMSEAEALSRCARAVELMVDAAGAKLPPAAPGRPASLDGVLRRLQVRKLISAGETASAAFEAVGGKQLVVVSPEGHEVHPAVSVESLQKHYYRDRKRFADEDAYMACFERALEKYGREIV